VPASEQTWYAHISPQQLSLPNHALKRSFQSHVICEPQAAQVIKTYSPNIMVHPLMRQSSNPNKSADDAAEDVAQAVIQMLSRVHVLVIGPGLGRDKLMQDTCALVIKAAREKGMPFVLDADGLYLAQMHPELVQGCKECILTPNIVEFGRLCKSKGIQIETLEGGKGAAQLSEAFGGVTIIQKGAKDYISNGVRTFVSDLKGGLKRSGGQGDTLTGSLGTFLAWRKAYLDRIWDHDGDLDSVELLALAAFGGSSITRVSRGQYFYMRITADGSQECSRLAFAKRGRSLQASDLTDEVATAFTNLFEGPESKL
jgi:ATP-dependent NAD(P)H-hydrate dehydratase